MTSLIQKFGWQHYCHQTRCAISDEEYGRVQTVNKTNYQIITKRGILPGELTGQLQFTLGNEERPQTGDWVKILEFESQCIITEVLPRYSQLARKAVGKSSEKQLIAANIDKAIIVQGLDRDFNPRRLVRMATVLSDAAIDACVVLNKTDIAENVNDQIMTIKSALPEIELIPISALNKTGIEALTKQLQPFHTNILIGSSGAGKSTLLNALTGSSIQKTKEISSAVNKGVHTTTSREIFQIPNGSLIIDTAGVREFGLALDDSESVAAAFNEIALLAQNCRYDDCSHADEPGCAVINAVNEQQLDIEQYNNFIKLRNEAEHYAASQIDKKRKGKDLSKLVRNMKRYNIKKRY